MLHGIISIPVADLRASPEDKSERVNQALFGTPAVILDQKDRFARISLPDKYTGWTRLSHIHQVGFASWQKYIDQPKYRVKSAIVTLTGPDGKGVFPFRVYFGTELIAEKEGKTTVFQLPAGARVPVDSEQLASPPTRKTKAVDGAEIVETALGFIGAPYLWGGVSPAGFDCSGLVQTVYRFYGIELPRDSKDQRTLGRDIDRKSVQSGDLLFFPGHVAISCGGEDFVHASSTTGMVACESFNQGSRFFREDLVRSFEVAKRIPL
jgi:hypothetical protein